MTLRRSPSSILARFGTATLVAGAVTGIAAGCITDPDQCTILLSRNTPVGTLGFLSAPVDVRTPSLSTFRILSSNAADTSTVNWLAIPKNAGLASSTEFVNTASLRRSPSGLNVLVGYATLVAGTKTVTGIQLTPESKIFVCAATIAGTSGKLSVPDATVDESLSQFVINSNSGTDTSVITYVVVSEPLRFSPSGRVFSQAKGAMADQSAVFTKMDPFLEGSSLAVIASVASIGGTPGNLAAPLGGSRAGGSVTITSTAAETSLIEAAAF